MKPTSLHYESLAGAVSQKVYGPHESAEDVIGSPITAGSSDGLGISLFVLRSSVGIPYIRKALFCPLTLPKPSY